MTVPAPRPEGLWRPERCQDWPCDDAGRPLGAYLHAPVPHDCAIRCELNCAAARSAEEGT